MNNHAPPTTLPQPKTNSSPVESSEGTKPDVDESYAELDDFLDVLYGDEIGYVHLATGRDPYLNESGKYQFPKASFRQVSFRWPEQWTELAEAVQQAAATDADVYLAPYVLSGDRRVKGTAVERRHIHTDVDDQVDLEKVRELGGAAVDSGSPGHAQVYVFLSETVNAAQHQALCRLLCAYLGGDKGKISDNDLLRPPGTVNRKPTVRGGQAAPVRWLIPPAERRVWDPAELAKELAERTASSAPAPTVEMGTGSNLDPVDLATLPERVQSALNKPIGKADGSVDRSATTMAVVGACKDAGFTLERTRTVVRLREDLAGRLDERNDDDVLTCWLRVVDDRQGREYDHSLVGILQVSGETGAPRSETSPSVPTVSTPDPPDTWVPVDLTGVLAELTAGTFVRAAPTIGVFGVGRALFYRGKVNLLSGDSNVGKSWTALATVAQQLAAGEHVLYIDLESNYRDTCARLVLDLGCEIERIAEFFHYVDPDRIDVDKALALIRRYGVAFVVIDSIGEALALCRVNGNNDDEVAHWFRTVPGRLAREGPAVLGLDHTNKSDVKDPGLYGTGSFRKRAAASGAAYMQRKGKPFRRGQPGYSKIVCAKDREGNYAPDEHVANLDVTDDGVFSLVPPPFAAADADGEPRREFRPTVLMERVSVWLAAQGQPQSTNQIEGAKHGKTEYVRKALDVLVKEGYVERFPGSRNAVLHRHLRAFRQADPDLFDAEDPVS